MRNPALHRPTLLTLLLSIPVGAVTARAQQSAPVQSAQGRTFDVVSIRQNISPTGSGAPHLAPAPDGFQVTRVPLVLVLLTAYTPKAGGMFLNTIDNLPDWARHENYDIDARIGDADRAAWNDPKNQPAMLQEMLEAMLADRFKLVVHREMKEKPVFELVVAKGGVKFAETRPDEPRPSGATLPGGGVMGPPEKPGVDGAHLYNFSMGLLASLLSEKSDRTVVDETGLTGRYSFDIVRPASMAAPSAEDDPQPAMFDVVKELGLKIEPAKEQVETLVIDHVERPTAN